MCILPEICLLGSTHTHEKKQLLTLNKIYVNKADVQQTRHVASKLFAWKFSGTETHVLFNVLTPKQQSSAIF